MVFFQVSICFSVAALAAGSAMAASSIVLSSPAVRSTVWRMVLAWKKFHRSEASMFWLSAAVCALLPSVSENARHSARIAMTSAIFLLECPACSTCSACSSCSCASLMLVPSGYIGRGGRLAQPGRERKGQSGLLFYDIILRRKFPQSPMSRRLLGARMGAAIDLEQPFAVDRGVDLRGRQGGVAEELLDGAQVAAARQQMGGEGMAQRMRGRGFGEAEEAAQPLHGELHDPGRQRPALGADE